MRSAKRRYSCSLMGTRHLDGIDLRDGGEHRILTDEIADLGDADPGDAVDRGRHPRPVEVELRLLHRRTRRLDLGARGAICLNGVVELLLADRALSGQRRVACNVLCGLGESRFGARQLPAGFVQRRFVLARIDREEQVSRTNQPAFSVVLRLQVSLHARADLRVDRAVGGTDPLRVNGNVLLLDRADDDVRWRWRRRLVFLAAARESENANPTDQSLLEGYSRHLGVRRLSRVPLGPRPIV